MSVMRRGVVSGAVMCIKLGEKVLLSVVKLMNNLQCILQGI